VVADLCDRAIVMYAGQVVEEATVDELSGAAAHPYTRLLLAANTGYAPDGATVLPTIPGTIPVPGEWPAACHFSPRCPQAAAACTAGPIPLRDTGAARRSRCIMAAAPAAEPARRS
jgi:peptide/nickel transport system permease protein